MGLRRLRAVCLGLGLSLLGAVAQADLMRIGSWDCKTDPLVVSSEAILTRAYADLKQPVESVDLLLRRAMVMLLNHEWYGNLFRVAPPASMTEVRAYAVNAALQTTQWKQLEGLRVVFQQGTLVIELNMPPTAHALEQIPLHHYLSISHRDLGGVNRRFAP